MRRGPVIAPLVIGLSQCGLTCQKSEQAPGEKASANAANASGGAAAPPPAAPVTHLKAGGPAPDFALTDTEGQTLMAFRSGAGRLDQSTAA